MNSHIWNIYTVYYVVGPYGPEDYFLSFQHKNMTDIATNVVQQHENVAYGIVMHNAHEFRFHTDHKWSKDLVFDEFSGGTVTESLEGNSSDRCCNLLLIPDESVDALTLLARW